MEQTDDETLVDGKLLSYAYLEAGVIEMIGSYVYQVCNFLEGGTDRIGRRLVAYFVVFFKHGFAPNDLRRAQQENGKQSLCDVINDPEHISIF